MSLKIIWEKNNPGRGNLRRRGRAAGYLLCSRNSKEINVLGQISKVKAVGQIGGGHLEAIIRIRFHSECDRSH